MKKIEINVITQAGNLVEKEITVSKHENPCGSYALLHHLLDNPKVSALQKMDVLLQCLTLSNAMHANNWVCAQVSPPDFVVELKDDRYEVFFFAADDRVKKVDLLKKNSHSYLFPLDSQSLPISYFTPYMLKSSSPNKVCSALTNKYAFAQLVLESLKKIPLDALPDEDMQFDSVFGEQFIEVTETEKAIFNDLQQLATNIVESPLFIQGDEWRDNSAALYQFEEKINTVNKKIKEYMIEVDGVCNAATKLSTQCIVEMHKNDISTTESLVSDDALSVNEPSVGSQQTEQWTFSPNREDKKSPKRRNNIPMPIGIPTESGISGISPISTSLSSYYVGSMYSSTVMNESDDENESRSGSSFSSHRATILGFNKDWENGDTASITTANRWSQKSLASRMSNATVIVESAKNNESVSEEVKSALKSVIEDYQNLIKERQKNGVSYWFQRHGSAGYARAQKLLEAANNDKMTVSELNDAIRICFADYEKTSYLKDCGTSKNSLTRHILANHTLVDFLNLKNNLSLEQKIKAKTGSTFIQTGFINDWTGKDSANHALSFFSKSLNRKHMKEAAGIVKGHLAKGMCAMFMFFMNSFDIFDALFDVSGFV